MKRNFFRNISVIVICSLLCLAAVQSVWVYRMYNDSVSDFTRRVESAAYKSIYKAFRMDAIPGIATAKQIDINLDRFALYFETNLLELDALQPYRAEVIDAHTMRTMMIRYEQQSITNPFTTQIAIDDDNLFLLHLSVEIPYKVFWGRMWGIILSSAAIIVLLGAVLVYILNTMFRQRTLEQMRKDFTHNITHELKTPISVAVAATDALRNFSADSDIERRSRYLEMVETQLTQLSEMVERILSVSVEGKEERFNPEMIDIVDIISSLKDDLEINCHKELTFSLQPQTPINIRADKFHIRNMLSTVFDNAVKYSAQRLTISVVVTADREQTTIKIADNGYGISRQHIKHIFEKFYRVPSGDLHSVRGYGLGLYYARKVANMHGGDITATSRIGVGTTITIKLMNNEPKD